MKSLSLILRVLAILAGVAAAVLFFMGQGKLAEKEATLSSTQGALANTQNELTTANEQISSLNARLNSEREALAESKRQLESVRSEMYTAKQEVTRTQQQLREARSSISELEQTSRRLRSDLVATEQSLAAASKEAEIAELNDRIAALNKANEELKQDLTRVQDRTQLSTSETAATGSQADGRSPTATDAPRSNAFTSSSRPAVGPAAIGAETTIASISAANGILILENREGLGLAPGQELTLIKDLKALGKVKISSIGEGFAVADILPGANTRAMTAGTEVRVLR